jgi:hypothetical protein
MTLIATNLLSLRGDFFFFIIFPFLTFDIILLFYIYKKLTIKEKKLPINISFLVNLSTTLKANFIKYFNFNKLAFQLSTISYVKNDSLWIKWIHCYYVKNDRLLTMPVKQSCSWILMAILNQRDTLLNIQN